MSQRRRPIPAQRPKVVNYACPDCRRHFFAEDRFLDHVGLDRAGCGQVVSGPPLSEIPEDPGGETPLPLRASFDD